jgi:Mg2+ and Co2+ transporter CorA
VPEFHWRFGYEWVLSLIVLLTAGQLVWFKRRRWI